MNAKERVLREMAERGFIIDPVRIDETEDPYEIERRSNELFRNDDMYRRGAEFDSVIRHIDVEDPQEQGYILTGLYTSMLADYRFFRWKAWLKALDMTVKTSKKEVRIEKKENARRAA